MIIIFINDMKILRYSAKGWNTFGQYKNIVNSTAKSWQLDSSPGWFCEKNTVSDNEFPVLADFKESKYNITRNYDNEILIFNTASEAIVLLTHDEYNIIIQNLSAGRTSISEVVKLLSSAYSLGLIVDVKDEETLKIDFVINQSKYNTDNVKSFVIYPTNECNARCFYCFAHNDVMKSQRMSDNTINDVLKFIFDHVSIHDEVVFRWFGGEPLMGVDIIRTIINRFSEHYNNQVQYHSIITTNASLFTPKLLKEAIEVWHVKKLLIPLDGYASEHNKRKNYRDNQHDDEYQFIIDFMGQALEQGVHVVCRLNLDRVNVANIDSILYSLLPYSGHPRFYLQATTLHIPTFALKWKNINYFTTDDFSQLYKDIFQKMLFLGFYKSPVELFPRRQMSVCEAKLNNHIIIAPDGTLYCCEQQNQCAENAIGHCRTGIIHNSVLKSWYDESLTLECQNCKLLPICLGGCSYYRRRGDGYVTPCTRFKFYFEQVFDILYENVKPLNTR